MNERAVLLSVAPEFAAKIALGLKTVELRRRFPAVPLGTWIYLYVTQPVGAVLGRARTAAIDIDAPARLWSRHRKTACLERSRFDDYFRGSERGVAVGLAEFEPIAPVTLSSLRNAIAGFVAPQSYRFLDVSDQRTLTSNRVKQAETSSRKMPAAPGGAEAMVESRGRE